MAMHHVRVLTGNMETRLAHCVGVGSTRPASRGAAPWVGVRVTSAPYSFDPMATTLPLFNVMTEFDDPAHTAMTSRNVLGKFS